MIRHLDLFSGHGGFAIAVHLLGHQTIGFCDNEKAAQEILSLRWPGVPIHDDITTLGIPELSDAVYANLTAEQWQEFDMAAKRKDYDGAVELYQSGASIQDCADYYSISRQAMWKILQRRGVEFRPQMKYGEENHFWRGGMTADGYAHNYVEKAILRGEIVPTPCEVCGDDPTGTDGRRLTQAHHDDYNYPMRVRFLCQPCHHEWHKNNRAIARWEGGMPTELAGTIDLVTGGF